jgi:hypothetical protein
MSKRADIIEGSQIAGKKYGLVYTEKCGWIDLGHANPKSASDLWRSVQATQTVVNTGRGTLSPMQGRPTEGGGTTGRISYSQRMAKWGLSMSRSQSYYISPGLTEGQLRSIALKIFMDVSLKFEAGQSSFPYNLATDSGFSAEDLVSDLVGFYRAVLPPLSDDQDYVKLCEPVSKKEAESIWDEFGAVGGLKNEYFGPIVFQKDKKSGKRWPACGILPAFLNRIQPAQPGEWFKEMSD